jgi:SAM-dependent methyltransferase
MTSRLLSVISAVVLVLVWTSAATAQSTPDYKPTVGQAGKDVVWVPSPPEMVERMLDLAKVTTRDLVVDLGSGDGRNVIAAAKRGARGLGVEYNPDLVELSKRTAAAEGVGDRATFVQGDMYEADISQATVLALFLLPENLRKLTPKFLDLKPGTRVVANTFAIAGWDAVETVRLEGDCRSWCEAMLYIIPAKVAGTWTMPEGRLMLEQDFQKVTGTIESGGETRTIDSGSIVGSDLTFTIGPRAYSGRVTGDLIDGLVKAEGREEKFNARRTNR